MWLLAKGIIQRGEQKIQPSTRCITSVPTVDIVGPAVLQKNVNSANYGGLLEDNFITICQ
jgi:hypothetical protein